MAIHTHVPTVTWKEIEQAHFALDTKERELVIGCDTGRIDVASLVSDLRGSLAGHRPMVALSFIGRFASHIAGYVLPELLDLASAQTEEGALAAGIVRRLPADEIRSQAIPIVERLLNKGTGETYDMLLSGVIIHLDKDFAAKVALSAMSSPDPDIQAVGREFVGQLNVSVNGE